jgi:lantibiotic modifying enzyme
LWKLTRRKIDSNFCLRTIEKTAITANDVISWRISSPSAAGVDVKDINTGSAGTLIALCCLQDVHPNENRGHFIRSCASSLARPLPPSLQIPGLYVGLAGTSVALLRAGITLGDEDIAAAGWRLMLSISSSETSSPDLFNGKAGLLRSALMFYHAMKNTDALVLALELGRQLSLSSQTYGQHRYWSIPKGFGGLSEKTYFGYAHGAAGIADCLLDLYDITGDTDLAEVITGAAIWLEDNSSAIGPAGGGVAWASYVDSEVAPAFWCHGAAGISRFFLRLVERGMYATARSIAGRALWAIERTIRWSRPTLCHGLAGAIHSLIDGFIILGKQEMYDSAHAIYNLMEAFSYRTEAGLCWETQFHAVSTPEYMVGYSGLIPTLLRLHDASVADPLSVTAFLPTRGLRVV